MAEEKVLNLDDMQENLEQAAEAERSARESAEENVEQYTHTFRKPFTLGGKAVESLTFDWGALTGADHNASCKRALEHGWTTVVREFTPPYLTAMAELACTERDEKGRRTLKYADLERMSVIDLTKIQDAARRFLTKSGS
jgi:hypothetical protein